MICTGLLALPLGLSAGPRPAQCQALVLRLNVSGLIDSTAYRLQLDGLAGALLDPDVSHVLLVFAFPAATPCPRSLRFSTP